MPNRRDLLIGAAAATVAGTAVRSARANSESGRDLRFDPHNQTPEQKAKHAIRFSKLDNESEQNFIIGFKDWMTKNRPAMAATVDGFLKSKGLSSTDPTTMEFEDCFNLLMQIPAYAMKTRLDRSAQHLMFDRAIRAFHRDGDHYLAEMEKTDKAGPGKLELNPDLEIPHYARHEIHTQPGGYVGDPLAGWVYQYAVQKGHHQKQSVYEELHLDYAQALITPEDGKVRRILDLGCGAGQSTTAIKERFPDAEVWGIDVGGPMVRYAHHRAVNMGIDVNFAQRLVEDNKFPDNYFDIVADYIVFHEIQGDVAKTKAVQEVHRVLRPGGVFNHLDVGTVGHPKNPAARFTIPGKAIEWVQYRFNHEVWNLDYMYSDFPAALRKTGLKVTPEALANTRYDTGLVAIKVA